MDGDVGGKVGREVAKTTVWKHPMSSHDAHTAANDKPVGHRLSGGKPRSLLPHCHPPWLPLFQPLLWRVGKMLLRNANQLTFNT